ncbi:MAG TPA: hypothetical protein VMA77_20360 [Solirubrobacteraceae bacterium]|nr:hypothetical protein [Solirubrobacteraceae bacterium]
MKRNKKRIIAAVAVIGALAAGGAAYTAGIAGNPPATAVAGFHQTTISGAYADSVAWDLSSDGMYISDAKLVLSNQGDTAQLPAGTVVKAGFDTDGGGTATLVTCTSTGVDVTDANATDYTCSFGTSDPVDEATVFNISVSDATQDYLP